MEKSAIEKHIEWMEGEKNYLYDNGYLEDCAILCRAIKEARRLAAEEKAKPTAPASLRQGRYPYPSFPSDIDQVTASISCALLYIKESKIAKDELRKALKYAELINEKLRYQPAESLAELADRKGLSIGRIWYAKIAKDWRILLDDPNDEDGHIFFSDTYPEAEAKAREYLNGLPDKENTK